MAAGQRLEMIRYALRCSDGHLFDAWFRDSAAFERLSDEGRVACAVCGTSGVVKSLMAPSVKAEGKGEAKGGDRVAAEEGTEPTPLAEPASPAERALAGLRRYLGENSDYVGRTFADEARRIHLGEAEARSIWGEASLEDARALRDEGVPVAPLPWLSRRDD
jgi:hypothetical protein